MQCYCCLPISSDRSRIFVWCDTVVWYKTVWSSAVYCIFVWFPFQCSADTWPVSTICGQQKQSALFLIVFKQFHEGSEQSFLFKANPLILNDIVSINRSSFCYHEAQEYHSAPICCFFNQTGSPQQDYYNSEPRNSDNLSQLSGAYPRLTISLGIKLSFPCPVQRYCTYFTNI